MTERDSVIFAPAIHAEPVQVVQTHSLDELADASRATLVQDTLLHQRDVRRVAYQLIQCFTSLLEQHDADKITDLDGFEAGVRTKFKDDTWWQKHLQRTRHHLQNAAGVRPDVNLLDVLESLVDTVVAATARTGGLTTPVKIPDEVLRLATENTVKLLQSFVFQATNTPSPHTEIYDALRPPGE